MGDDATPAPTARRDGGKVTPAAPRPGARDNALNMAVQLYVGVGVSAFPTRLPSALEAYFGSERGFVLRERVERLLAEATIDWRDSGTSDLKELTQRVADRMSRDHPELSADAVRALAWNFSYRTG